MNSGSVTLRDINTAEPAAEQQDIKDRNKRRETKPPSPEMSLKDAAKKYKRVGSMVGRAVIAGILCLVLLYLSAAPEIGLASPTIAGVGGIILFIVLNLLVILLCIDRFMIGIGSIFMLRMDANSLIAVANILSIVDGIVLLISKSDALPMNAVCALSLVIPLLGNIKGAAR